MIYPIEYLVIVPDGSDEMEVAPIVEIPGWTKVVEGTERVDVKVAGWDNPIYMFHGLKIVPYIMIDEVNVDEYDAICLPGGWHGTQYFDQIRTDALKNILREADKKGKIIATMCNGVLALGEAGLLGGKKCTSFTGECCELCRSIKPKLESYGAKFQEKSIVIDGKLISNIGPAVADEVAMVMLEKLIGAESVKKIVDMMMYNRVYPKELKWTGPVTPKTKKK